MALEHDVADLEQKLASLQVERDALLSESAAQHQELTTLRIEALVARATSKREGNRSEAMFTILNQVSVLLIQGIKRMEARDREERLRAQEDRIGVGDVDRPAFLPTPTKRSMHLDSHAPGRDVPGEEGDTMNDLDSRNVWQMRAGRWSFAGVRERDYTPEPAPTPAPAPEPRPAPVSANPSALPATTHHVRAGDRLVVEAPRAGTVRNDIVDKRLPLVEFGPDDDQRALGELAETVLRKG